jgi:hypothetical protein
MATSKTDRRTAAGPKIESAHLCELAFLDTSDRLCLVGITTRFPVPSLPLEVRQVMLAARVVDVPADEPLAVGLFIVTPSGRLATPNEAETFKVELTAEYVLVTLWDLPLKEEGLYRFGISINDGEAVTIDVPVLLVEQAKYAGVH